MKEEFKSLYIEMLSFREDMIRKRDDLDATIEMMTKAIKMAEDLK